VGEITVFFTNGGETAGFPHAVFGAVYKYI